MGQAAVVWPVGDRRPVFAWGEARPPPCRTAWIAGVPSIDSAVNGSVNESQPFFGQIRHYGHCGCKKIPRETPSRVTARALVKR